MPNVPDELELLDLFAKDALDESCPDSSWNNVHKTALHGNNSSSSSLQFSLSMLESSLNSMALADSHISNHNLSTGVPIELHEMVKGGEKRERMRKNWASAQTPTAASSQSSDSVVSPVAAPLSAPSAADVSNNHRRVYSGNIGMNLLQSAYAQHNRQQVESKEVDEQPFSFASSGSCGRPGARALQSPSSFVSRSSSQPSTSNSFRQQRGVGVNDTEQHALLAQLVGSSTRNYGGTQNMAAQHSEYISALYSSQGNNNNNNPAYSSTDRVLPPPPLVSGAAAAPGGGFRGAAQQQQQQPPLVAQAVPSFNAASAAAIPCPVTLGMPIPMGALVTPRTDPTNSSPVTLRVVNGVATDRTDQLLIPNTNNPRQQLEHLASVMDNNNNTKQKEQQVVEFSFPTTTCCKGQTFPPLRPLSAYNYFFREERDRLLNGERRINSAGGNLNSNLQARRRYQLLWGHWGQDRTQRRPHRKSHGKISFSELTRVISTKWKALDAKDRDFYKELATMDMERFKREVDQKEEDRTATKQTGK